MGHHLILIPREINSSESSGSSDDSEEEEQRKAKKLIVVNLETSKIQKVDLPMFMDRDSYGDYTLIKHKENQIIKVQEEVGLITIESFERTGPL